MGWVQLPAGRARSVWRALSLPAGAAVVVLSAGSTAGDLHLVVQRSEEMAADQRALRTLLTEPEAAASVRRCRPVLIRDFGPS